jgi:hypothetical protein
MAVFAGFQVYENLCANFNGLTEIVYQHRVTASKTVRLQNEAT